MATYLALIHDSEAAWADPAASATGMQGHIRFSEAHGAAIRGGAELTPTDGAVTIRTDADGGLTLTDGAFAEAKEVLGGFYVFRADDRDAAVEIARHIPTLGGCIVVRGVVNRTEDPRPQFMALIHDREELWQDADAAAKGYAGHHAFMTDFADAIVEGQQLAPVGTATTVRADGAGGVTLTDGAFAEAKEVLGGFYRFEADDLDAALAITRDVPVLDGAVELRPAGAITGE